MTLPQVLKVDKDVVDFSDLREPHARGNILAFISTAWHSWNTRTS